jgi:mannosyl-3-phosphoglycerate phosphatase
MIVFSDLDGTLLDGDTYSFDAAQEALKALRARGIPLILVSSKTQAEIQPIRARLKNDAPFVVENGGAIFIPGGTFDFPIQHAAPRDGYDVVELGTPYAGLRQALRDIAQAAGCEARGFGDMSVAEIAEQTGLSLAEAALAKQRRYDEPFRLEGRGEAGCVEAFQRLAEARGLRYTRGGRFHHLMGRNDKGQATRVLIDYYRRQAGQGPGVLRTVALGDSLNDLPMLAVVDRPVLVKKADGSYDPEVRLPNVTYAGGIGPAGWNQAILALLSDQAA